jgi:Fic family protein
MDGNGRIGRILLNWQRRYWNLPILIIKESEKEEYYKWF